MVQTQHITLSVGGHTVLSKTLHFAGRGTKLIFVFLQIIFDDI